MKVVSAIKRVPEEIQLRLQTRFPEATFVFCHGMGEAKDSLEEADVFITYGEDLDKEKIQTAKKLKWIMVLSAGMDRMPFGEIAKRDILITNVRGIHAQPMAEYAISMLLQVSRKAKTLLEQEKNEEWNRRPVMQEISGKTMVLLGTGAIPQEVARLAKAFHMRTVGVSKSGKIRPYFDKVVPVNQLDLVLPSGDFVVAALPSTPETEGLLLEEHFNKMAAHTIFLNMGRGDLVSSEVILNAVRDGEIAHAVLDVFEEEPLPEGHPFWREENITVTPHLSGISPHYVPRGFDIFEENLAVFLSGEGELKNMIDPKRGY
ncbi:Phosphoglycerate dehydrogenase [Halobacillus karajensis]|uniref:Glyoxylate/hydroxypyruvate reductase B n=1 Tax=Halobacillus karajensis TaxID=195088 RepID=A0A024P771_9BACI|nr:D-2-hydroxyacid dehydrogenase [Halobacillus karajensis]CDQ20364.1 Glyoxylate/hydroxypyruvate reductase B [Halobacillus karajensis]CDQ24167.1 Glyoxylate/hydroxypyruvate reductase B [Halobacillus karajensis]CDQ27645.1 Glyoxylate/hydroxypyruvate reductase B [Halobacillus karajensis]SEH92806.1 Phosphoglycerate dehydrogenase [Halobacillus karajensis]